MADHLSQLSAIQNDDTFHAGGGVSNVKILSKSKGGATVLTVGNGAITDGIDYSQNKADSHESQPCFENNQFRQ